MGFYLNYPEDLPGPVFYSQGELLDYLKNLKDYSVNEQQRIFVERYMAACDGHSSERICTLIRDYMKIPYIMLTDKYKNYKKRLQAGRNSIKDKVLGSIIDRMEKKYE